MKCNISNKTDLSQPHRAECPCLQGPHTEARGSNLLLGGEGGHMCLGTERGHDVEEANPKPLPFMGRAKLTPSPSASQIINVTSIQNSNQNWNPAFHRTISPPHPALISLDTCPSLTLPHAPGWMNERERNRIHTSLSL